MSSAFNYDLCGSHPVTLSVMLFDPLIMCVFLQLSNAGGRIIIASDGVWDDLTCEMALDCSRGFPSDVAANRIVNVTLVFSLKKEDSHYFFD